MRLDSALHPMNVLSFILLDEGCGRITKRAQFPMIKILMARRAKSRAIQIPGNEPI